MHFTVEIILLERVNICNSVIELAVLFNQSE